MLEQNNINETELKKEVKRRRTFAIISHPDAGKTTLTEKLLLFGGAIHLAGAVKAKASQRHTTSDWMEIEKQRGISISTSVLQFEYQGYQINLLDTPGHKDFSEDTYRTLMAADSAVMLIDAAKGVEPQTKKLFEVCRMRGIPIFTFMNKLDRPSREPIALLDEIEKVLGIRSTPVSWPLGSGDRFRGVYDRIRNEVLVFERTETANVTKKIEPIKYTGIHDPKFLESLEDDRDYILNELELMEMAGTPLDLKKVLQGELTPVFFGSAMNNFGVEHFLNNFIEMSPPPTPRLDSNQNLIEPSSQFFSGFIFKIQANMDPQHRDRVAFMRICSGKFERNMMVFHSRLKKQIKLSKPLNFFGQERVIVDMAWPGDIIGLLDTSGELRIGDTLSEKNITFQGVPSFSPEHFAQVQILDPLKRKQLKKGLDQLSEEGVVQVYSWPGMGDKDPILGAVGELQLEVFQHRVKSEYGVEIRLNRLSYTLARWVKGSGIDFFKGREDSLLLEDRDHHYVVLFKSEWSLNWAMSNAKNVEFYTTAPLS
jgi:peptide chain release factor 3